MVILTSFTRAPGSRSSLVVTLEVVVAVEVVIVDTADKRKTVEVDGVGTEEKGAGDDEVL